MLEITHHSLVSMADMSRTPYVIALLIVVGIVALHFLRPANARPSNWLPIAAFVAGPIIALGYFVADVFLVSRDYLTASDYIQSLIPMLIIGFIGGGIGSVSFWIGGKLAPAVEKTKPDHLDSTG